MQGTVRGTLETGHHGQTSVVVHQQEDKGITEDSTDVRVPPPRLWGPRKQLPRSIPKIIHKATEESLKFSQRELYIRKNFIVP